MDWALLGGITGSVGMVTGAAGGIIALVCLHRVERVKASDLRMARLTAENKVQVALAELTELCDKAYHSRTQRITLEGGLSKSLETQKWKEQIERYRLQIDEISRQFERLKKDSRPDSLQRLERDTAKLQLLELQTNAFVEKFKNLIAEDNVARMKLMRTGYGA